MEEGRNGNGRSFLDLHLKIPFPHTHAAIFPSSFCFVPVSALSPLTCLTDLSTDMESLSAPSEFVPRDFYFYFTF